MDLVLHTTPEDDQVLGRLAAAWGVSEQQAVLRAVREALDRELHRAQVSAASVRMRERWARTLDDLGRS